MNQSYIPPQYLEISQLAGGLRHRASAYAKVVREARASAGARTIAALQQERSQLWLEYAKVKRLFDSRYPPGMTLRNGAMIEHRATCHKLLVGIRADILPVLGAAAPARSGPGSEPPTRPAPTRRSPAARGGKAPPSSGRAGPRSSEGEALQEALNALDRVAPPFGRARGAGVQQLRHGVQQLCQRIRAAASPGFATALDGSVDPALVARVAASHPAGMTAGQVRRAYADAAARRFAADLVRLVAGRPPAAADDAALAAIVAVAVARTSARLPIVPPKVIAPMAVLAHRSLRPQLRRLARMATMVAAPPAAARSRRSSPPSREMAW